MASPDFFGEPRTPRLSALLNEIRRGQIRIPRFQRPFVWNDDQRLLLLDSIYRGYPIGSILVWRTQKHILRTHDRLGPARIPHESMADRAVVRQYLLDGHQRLTTLFAALGPGLTESDQERRLIWEPDPEDSSKMRWPIFFDLEDSEGSPIRLQHGRQPARLTWLRLDILYDSYALGEFKDKLRQAGHDKALINRIQSVADTFRDYAVPVVPIATEDLDQVTTSFKRVNSGGTRMSEVHMVNALTYGPNFDLETRLADISLSLRDIGWGNLDPQMLLNICKTALGRDVHKADIEDLAKDLTGKPETLDNARDSLRRAAGVLHRIAGICGPGAIPYAHQAVLLADALSEDSLSATQELALQRWFWATSLSEYFRGMNNSLFTRSRGQLRAMLAGKASPIPQDAVTNIDERRDFHFLGARARAMSLMLAELRPVDPFNAEQDPAQILAEFGSESMVKLIANRELPHEDRALADGPENRFLLHPRSGDELRHRLTELGGERLASSHAISKEAHVALCRGDLAAFLRLRRQRIAELERAKVEELGLTYHATAS